MLKVFSASDVVSVGYFSRENFLPIEEIRDPTVVVELRSSLPLVRGVDG